MLGDQRLAGLDALRAHAAQVGFVRLDEFGLRAVGCDRLAMDADAGKDRIGRFGADAALERRAADLGQERLESGLVGGGLRCGRHAFLLRARRGARDR